MSIQEPTTHQLLTERQENFGDSYSQPQDTQDHNIIMVIWRSALLPFFYMFVTSSIVHFQQAPLCADSS